jgi:hypothetical protein
MRSRLLASAVLVLAVFIGGDAWAQVGPTIEDQCVQGGGSGQMCRGPEHLAILAAYECRVAGGGDECTVIDGRTQDPDAVVAASASWTATSLAFQRSLDDDLPLQEELWAHTHNSYNADEYRDQTLYGTDPNQTYTIPHQLDMGIRAVEIDLHWAPSIANPGGKAVIVCHGNQDIPPRDELPSGELVPPVHVGCLPTDPTFAGERSTEIADWLEGHPDEVVMLYLENQLQDSNVAVPEAHDDAAATIAAALGQYIYRPATSACSPAPLGTLSRADILAAGKQLIVVGNCQPGGPSAWNSWVFSREPLWEEGGLAYGDDFNCATDRSLVDYETHWVRHWGDQTGLSDGVGGGGDVTVTDARNMVRCGVNMIGFDLLEPHDPRLDALVWSWAPNHPANASEGYCIVHGSDARFRSDDCTVKTTTVLVGRKGHKKRKVIETYKSLPYACFDGENWHVTSTSGRWSDGDVQCAAEQLGAFAIPRNGWQNEQLRLAKGAVPEVWLNSAFHTGSGWSS